MPLFMCQCDNIKYQKIFDTKNIKLITFSLEKKFSTKKAFGRWIKKSEC